MHPADADLLERTLLGRSQPNAGLLIPALDRVRLTQPAGIAVPSTDLDELPLLCRRWHGQQRQDRQH